MQIPFFALLSLVLIWPELGCTPKKDSAIKQKDRGSEVKEPIYPAFGPARPLAAPVMLEHLTIMTATGKSIEDGYVLLKDGKIAALGQGDPGPQREGAEVIDGRGKVLTPGIIDTHSHMGVYPLPQAEAHQDGNESTNPTTPDVWAEHSFWPQDPSLWRALAAGVTTAQILPGSANLVGGRAVTVHLRPGIDLASMRFPDAPQGVKMACGENPKRTYGKKSGPATRMGNIAGFRRIFQDAIEYRSSWERYRKKLAKKGDDTKDEDKQDLPPKRDHALDTIVKAMAGEILVHVHCYRADEMSIMMDLAKTYGFKVRSFHHAVEAYKIRDRLAAEDVAVSTWADWWGFKMESFDGIPQNAPMVHAAKGRAIIHSDSEEEIRHLPLEAVKARAAARSIGLDASDEELLQWITINPAWALGIDDKVGTIELGKRADVVLWDRSPFSTYAKPLEVYIEGERVFDRQSESFRLSDVERGIHNYGLADRGLQTEAKPGEGIPESKDLPALKAPADIQDRFLIEHANIETGLAQRIPDASLWVENGLIKAINPDPATLPADLPRLDAGGRTLTPGLIEVQSQLGLLVVELEDDGHDLKASDDLNPAFRAIDGFDPYSFRIPISRSQGLTSAFIKPTGGVISGQGQAFELSGRGDSLVPGVPPVMYASIFGAKKINRAQFWLKLRTAFADASYYKSHGGRSGASGQALSLAPLHLEALAELMEGRMPLVLSAHRLADIQAAIRLKSEMPKLRLILSGAGEAWLAKDELAAAKIPVILTPSREMPRNLDELRVRDDQAALLQAAGVTIIISTDDINSGRLRQEAGRAVTYALPYQAALAALTSVPAAVFGLNDRGVIAPSKRADLVLWSGDPLEAKSTVERLWIKGRAMDLSTRQLELAKAYQTPY